MADGYVSSIHLPNDNTYDIKDKNAVIEIQINGTAQTKTNGVVNLPAHVTQSNSTSGNYRAIMLGYEEISDNTPYSISSVTNRVYKTEKFQYNPSGGILKNSGHIYIKSDNLDRDGEAPTSDQTGKSLYFVDKDNNGVGRIYTVQRKTNNKKDLFITIYNASGTSNSIGIRILDDGTPSYYLSYPSAFRTTLDNAAYIGENTITNSQVIIADGTDGKLKSSGYTIAANIPSDAVFTDENVLQQNSTSGKYRPIALIAEEYSNLSSYSTTSTTDKIFKSANAFLRASDGTFYGGAFVACDPISAGTSNTTAKRTYINAIGLYTDNYMANYSIAAYGRQVITSYPGKCTSNNGLLLKIDSGGLTIVGGGESGANLAGLISNDQTIENPDRLDINNSARASGKETTAFTGDSEQLILSSDGSIYFATACNTIANRVAVCLNSSRTFYPMTDNTGSIGSSSYKWQYGYFGQIYGTGGSGKWRVARDNASFINNTPSNTGGYVPAIDLKTTNGDWSVGSLGGEENLYFAYVADSIYSGTDNTARKYRLYAPSTPDSNTYDILHTGNLQTYTIPNVTSIGTLPSLVTKDTSFYPVKSTTTTASKIVSKDTTIYPVKSTTTTASKVVGKDTSFYPVTSSTTTASKIVTKDTTIYPVTSSTTTASKIVGKDTSFYPVTSSTTTATKTTLGTAIAADDITSWDAGTLPELGEDIPVNSVTSWSAGTLPTISTTNISADDITSWSAGTLPSFTVSKGILTLNSGTLPSLSYTARSIPNVTSAGTLPSLTYSSVSIPNISSVGTLPSLSYTARSIPNVTGNTNVTVPILSSSVTIKEISTNTDVTVPILSSSVTVKGISTISDVTVPILSSSVTVKGISTNTDVTVPILSSSVTIKEISTNTDVTVPILSSSVTISGVSTWSAGTLPSLGTAISVVGLSST